LDAAAETGDAAELDPNKDQNGRWPLVLAAERPWTNFNDRRKVALIGVKSRQVLPVDVVKSA